jgi:hypothetical protein
LPGARVDVAMRFSKPRRFASWDGNGCARDFSPVEYQTKNS